ncbi:hypothetical protein J7E71_19835 [Mesobacillus foraminis]|uniref:hypothetical protein n=1 Tax=Mesobacillus foraminis TaxID=279826 RepID=UPI001BE99AB0|nr:hypothetical protein [Mesobacillus foraminis]MBT2758121.1 hypothetical protein [Mesobacillus foraminis]
MKDRVPAHFKVWYRSFLEYYPIKWPFYKKSELHAMEMRPINEKMLHCRSKGKSQG